MLEIQNRRVTMNLYDMMQRVFTLSDDCILHRGIEGERYFFLFNVSTGKIFRLNETSFIILESFSENSPLSSVIDNLTKKFSVDKDILIKDLSGLIKKWIEIGVLIVNE